MSSGFVSEADLQKQRETRQQEWEKVRTEDQPLGKNILLLTVKMVMVIFCRSLV